MSYAEHGPRIFLAGRPGDGVHSTYGDYVAPQKRSEGRLKMYESCTDIRAWSPNLLESTRYFRELNEHPIAMPGKVMPVDVVIENMIGFTAKAQKDLRVAQRRLRKYESLKLTPEQRRQLESCDKVDVERDGRMKEEDAAAAAAEELRIGPVIEPLLSRETLLFHPSRLVCSRHLDTCLSMYLRPGQRFRYDGEICSSLLASMRVSRESRFASSSSENETFLVSRVTSCDLLSEEKATRECSNQASICIEYVDASAQAVQTVCEVCVQTDGYGEEEQTSRRDVDSCSSQYYGSSECASTSECGVTADHKRIIIEKDSEIIVLQNELGMKEDELEELRQLNRRLEEKYENARSNFNILQKKLQIVSDKRKNEANESSAKLSASEGLADQLKAELVKKCQVCHFQSQEIQQLRARLENADFLSAENESLARKVKEIECLSKEAESRGIALEQMKSVWQERDMLQEQCRTQSCTLADQEGEIQRLLTLLRQMSVTDGTREAEINEMSVVVADLRNEIRAKDDKISRCEVQLNCMEREVGNLTSMLKSSLNSLDESKMAYERICEHARCEHDTCLDVHSALDAMGTFIAALEEHKRERRDHLQEIDNLRNCMTCYSQETVSEIANADFHTGRESIQTQAAAKLSNDPSGKFSVDHR